MFHGPVSLEVVFSLSLLHPGLAIACSPHLHGSRYIRGGPLRGTSLYARCTEAGCRGLSFLLGDPAGLTGCDLRPPGQFYPRQVGTIVKLPFPYHHTVVIAAPLYPSCALGQPLLPYSSGNIELLLHVGHVLEGVIFLYAPPLILAWEEVLKDFVP